MRFVLIMTVLASAAACSPPGNTAAEGIKIDSAGAVSIDTSKVPNVTACDEGQVVQKTAAGWGCTTLAAGTDLSGYARTADLSPFAKTADLAPFAKTADLGTAVNGFDARLTALETALQARSTKLVVGEATSVRSAVLGTVMALLTPETGNPTVEITVEREGKYRIYGNLGFYNLNGPDRCILVVSPTRGAAQMLYSSMGQVFSSTPGTEDIHTMRVEAIFNLPASSSFYQFKIEGRCASVGQGGFLMESSRLVAESID